MKKSFFLLTAALVAMFSFSACTDDKDDETTDPSSSSLVSDPSSSSNNETPPGPLGDLTAACQTAIRIMVYEMVNEIDVCMQASGLSSSDVIESDAECIEEGGTPLPECPSSNLVCPITIEGTEVDIYYPEPAATAIKEMFDGGCPPEDLYGE